MNLIRGAIEYIAPILFVLSLCVAQGLILTAVMAPTAFNENSECPEDPPGLVKLPIFNFLETSWKVIADEASFLSARVYYWFGQHYDISLLIQASVMVLIQLALLDVALTNRSMPDPGRDLNAPFAPVRPDRRPYDFWQWREKRPYFLFICYFTLGLGVLHLLLGGVPLYVNIIGYLALAVEATLPVPQILANQRNKSCKGFRPSVLVNWLLGDAFKMSFFFLSETTIPWAFKLCGLFQWACDIYLGIQYSQFGSSPAI